MTLDEAVGWPRAGRNAALVHSCPTEVPLQLAVAGCRGSRRRPAPERCDQVFAQATHNLGRLSPLVTTTVAAITVTLVLIVLTQIG
jgi:hypothetical protein